MIRALGAALLVCALAACTAPPPADPSARATGAPALLAEVNAARTARNLAPLPEAAALTQAASAHAADMATKGYFAHTAPDGSTPLRRMRAAGFNACYAAETIAKGQRTEAEVVESWTRSPEHAALMFSPNPTAAGASRAGTYWVMTLSRPC